MDGSVFTRLARAIGVASPRRRLVAFLIGLPAASLLTAVSETGTAARKHQARRRGCDYSPAVTMHSL
jgi:hypothetical protein